MLLCHDQPRRDVCLSPTQERFCWLYHSVLASCVRPLVILNTRPDGAMQHGFRAGMELPNEISHCYSEQC